MVYGRGTQRGDALTVSGLSGAQLKGWRWGISDAVKRWGQNRVESVEDGDKIMPSSAGLHVGDLLKATFDRDGGANEADLSVGDSGGGVFIRDATVWKLAGINYAVDGPYNLSDSGPGFTACVFDQGGLYTGSEGDWTLTPSLVAAQPGAFYATRISSHLAWINSVISAPVQVGPVLQSAAAASGPYTDEASAKCDVQTRTITIAVPGANRFYRLNAASPLTIESVRTADGEVILIYRD
jgi:hypothetical protein